MKMAWILVGVLTLSIVGTNVSSPSWAANDQWQAQSGKKEDKRDNRRQKQSVEKVVHDQCTASLLHGSGKKDDRKR